MAQKEHVNVDVGHRRLYLIFLCAEVISISEM